jgi:hypothetical protein
LAEATGPTLWVRTPSECGSSAAQQAQEVAGGLRCTLWWQDFSGWRGPKKGVDFPAIHRQFLASEPLTTPLAEDYIRPHDVPPASARWRVCEAPHCLRGDSSGHDLGHDGCAGIGSGFCRIELRRRSREVPGCLKSESEERETWTAESLRAAFAIGKPFALRPWKRLRRSTF